MTLQAKLEQRGSIVSSMRALTDQAETEQRDLNEIELKQFDDFKVNLRTLDNQIERTRVIEEAERALPVTPRPGFDDDFETQCRSFSICKAIANRLEPGSVDAGLETEISQELARRDNKSPTGILVPHEVFMEKRAMLTSEVVRRFIRPGTETICS